MGRYLVTVPSMFFRLAVTFLLFLIVLPIYILSVCCHYSRWRDGWVERLCDRVGEPVVDLINRLWN